jgi:hemerythrin superfamily protein
MPARPTSVSDIDRQRLQRAKPKLVDLEGETPRSSNVCKETIMASRARKAPARAASDALALLKKDHAEVKKLFGEFEKAKKNDDDGERRALVAAICEALTAHAQVEEEIFYPALRHVEGLEDLLDEAEVEHTSVKELVAELESAEPGDELYDARVKVLAEYVEHHVKEEEGEIFPKARKSDVDLAALGRTLTQRKAELGGDRGSEARDDDDRAREARR